MFIKNVIVYIQTKNLKKRFWHAMSCSTFILFQASGFIVYSIVYKYVCRERERERECVCVCVENTSVEYKIENKNGKKLNLLNSEMEKGKI